MEDLNTGRITVKFMTRSRTDEHMHGQFLAAKNKAESPSSTFFILRPEVPSCFREWNRSCEDVVSGISLEFRNNRWPSHIRFYSVSSSGASSSGSNAESVT